jgi:NADH:ubiquinone oxidoreductase subunit F (NADH-binding)
MTTFAQQSSQPAADDGTGSRTRRLGPGCEPGQSEPSPISRLLPPPGKPALDLAAHLRRHGQVPYRGRPGQLILDVRAAGLTGRGGAAFPVHRKLSAVLAAPGRPVVVANGAEGEPASAKDKSLLLLNPHLVLDGIQLAAEATGASDAVLYVALDAEKANWLNALLAGRRAAQLDRLEVRLFAAPPRFLAGQESALASRISGGPALPGFTPPRVFERGVNQSPTFVSNIETLAHLSLIARYGPQWFASAGTPDEPGTMICTLHQADGRVELTEAALGTPLADLLDLRAAVLAEGDDPLATPVSAVLIGGYHGAWLPAATAARLTLANAALRRHGATVGAGVLAALPAGRCGLAETARVARYLALESAGQCGPCRNGLPRIAAALADLADVTGGRRPDQTLLQDIDRWSGLVYKRGACAHPDGTVRFVTSALRTFEAEIAAHGHGGCTGTSNRPFLPLGTDSESR